jgi:hypothetical protein
MKLFDKMFKKSPVIMTEHGPVSEKARRQAAENMKNDADTKARVEAVLVNQYGTEIGLAEARRRYPEAYETN